MKKITPLIVLASLFMASFASAYLTKAPDKNNEQKTEALDSSNSKINFNVKGSHQKILNDNDYYLLLTFTTSKQTVTKKFPLNISIVIDRSGSMAEKNKLEFAKLAAKEFIKKLDAEDRVSLVEYDDNINVLAEPTLLGQNRETLIKKIDLLEPRGSTNLAGGMMEGARQVERFIDKNRVNRVLLLSDGLANTGVSTLSGVTELVENLGHKSIQVTTFGLGADFNEDMMARIADTSGGNYYFIESANQIASLFEKERYALSSVVGKSPRVTIKLSDQIELEDVYGYPFRKKGNTITVDIPDIYSGQNRKILLKVRPQIKEAHQLDVANVTLDYDDVVSEKRESLSKNWNVEVTNDKAIFEKSANSDVMVEVARANSGKQLEEAMNRYSKGDKSGAKNVLYQTKGMLQNLYQSTGSPTIKKEMEDLDKASSTMDNYAPASEEGKVFIKKSKVDSIDNQKN